jgi:predicted lipoprotein with Yx(FWY)xxD motif
MMAFVGVSVVFALGACATPTGSYDTSDGSRTAAGPEPSLDPADAVLAAPVGIPTEKLIATTIPKMGAVVTDAKGWVLYRFDKDTAPATASACVGQCAAVWPPVLSDGNPILEGIPASLVGTLTRDDGATQLTLGGWPLYRYVGDTTPGTWAGQMVNGTWFVSGPDGRKNLTCLPTATPTAAAPPAAGSGTGPGY